MQGLLKGLSSVSGACQHAKELQVFPAKHCGVQLQAVRAERGASVSEGAKAPLKPLVEVLREAKEAKEEAFQAVWRSMKTGAPLNPALAAIHQSVYSV